MKPQPNLLARIGKTLVADTAGLGLAATPFKVLLVNVDFDEDDDLDPSAMVAAIATTNGLSTIIPLEVGSQLESIDPATGDIIVTLKTPLGGWRWESTATPGTPETVYGLVVVNEDEDKVYGSKKLSEQFVCNANNQAVDFGTLSFRIPVAGITSV